MNNRFTSCVALLCFLAINLSAQSMLSGEFSPAGSGSAVLSYTKKDYTEFWAGDTEMTAPNEGLDQNIVNLFGKYAITDRLEAVVQLPFMSNKSKDGEVEDQSLQDISLFLKGKLYEKNGFVLGLGLGANIPTGYEAASLYSLGNGATSLDGLAILSYKTEVGLSVTAQGGYSVRSGDTPNAALFLAKLAYSHSMFYVDAAFGAQSSGDAIDIGGPGFSGPPDFPNTKVNYSQLLFSAYVPIVKHLGLTGHFGSVTSGRNIGKSKYFGFGVAVNW